MGEIDRLYREARAQSIRLQAENERLRAENERLREQLDYLNVQPWEEKRHAAQGDR